MFEDSLFSSRAAKGSRLTRWIVAASVGVQGSIVAGLLAAPLVWPDRLAALKTAPMIATVSLLKPVKVELVKPRVVTVTDAAAVRVPANAAPMVEARGGGRISSGPANAVADEGPVLMSGAGMKDGPLVGMGMGNGNGTGTVAVAAAPKSNVPLRVSSGVISGLLLAPIVPIYPRIAVAARVQGTVVVTATIDKRGRIVGLQVLSGPEMLRGAAAEAVREARYRPYLLNGEATDVVTTISVNFRMGG